MNEITLFVGHGSRDSDGNQEFLEFVNEIRRRVPTQHFEACFLELTTPTIPDGLNACIRQDADRIVVVPVILLAASHVKFEIPEYLDAARRKYPNVEIVYGRNIGLHEQMIDLLTDRFYEQAAMFAQEEIHQTAIVLMGRGSSDPDANGDLYKIARQVWEQTGVFTVEVCFTGITFPRLPDGIKRALSLGVKRVVVVPYFLFTGVLIKRMRDVLQEMQAADPTIPLHMAEYFGMHRRLIEIVLERREEALRGQSFMNCDLCKYRKLAAHEHPHNHDHHDHAHSHVYQSEAGSRG
ncbi:sirohydrochlorin chelatase [Ferroacidibacillus organovorans]|uniref:Sirohydrochlorin chelatase n=1 Tax=Ferroacidibacillus organovorans TaxID=1765683 RepID=A0A1V4ERJ0_9BACL|nr:sirohydrochlorin chelatase [Ferroacidibacillus organovorans]OPG15492.1 sirohydrochlorin chelatase [Ferroacidibacillus organovorans]